MEEEAPARKLPRGGAPMEEEDQKKLSEPRTPTGVGWKWDVVFLEFVILNYRVRPGNMCMNPVDARSVHLEFLSASDDLGVVLCWELDRPIWVC